MPACGELGHAPHRRVQSGEHRRIPALRQPLAVRASDSAVSSLCLIRRSPVEPGSGSGQTAALESRTCLGEQPQQRLQVHQAQLERRILEMLVGDSEVSIAEVQLDRGRVLAQAALELLSVLGAHDRAQHGQIGGRIAEEDLDAGGTRADLGVAANPCDHLQAPGLDRAGRGVPAGIEVYPAKRIVLARHGSELQPDASAASVHVSPGPGFRVFSQSPATRIVRLGHAAGPGRERDLGGLVIAPLVTPADPARQRCQAGERDGCHLPDLAARSRRHCSRSAAPVCSSVLFGSGVRGWREIAMSDGSVHRRRNPGFRSGSDMAAAVAASIKAALR